jgi:hypothetical protein
MLRIRTRIPLAILTFALAPLALSVRDMILRLADVAVPEDMALLHAPSIARFPC